MGKAIEDYVILSGIVVSDTENRNAGENTQVTSSSIDYTISSRTVYSLLEGSFSDGNGRTVRLWQNVILSNWEEIFEYVPIESQIKKYQEEYYLVIANCDHNGNSTEFIEFMLKMIDETLEDLMDSTSVQASHVSSYVNKLLDVMESGVAMTTSELMEKLNMKSRISFRDNYLNPALENGLIKMTNPDKPTSKNQMYYKV